jgi:hypothetical protein
MSLLTPAKSDGHFEHQFFLFNFSISKIGFKKLIHLPFFASLAFLQVGIV